MTEILKKTDYKVQIKKILTFKFMTDMELDNLIENCSILSFDEEEPIVIQGQTDQSFYAVIEGSVKVSARETEGKDIYICTIGDGEIFGEAGIFMKVKRTASVTSCTKTIVLRIERTQMLQFIKENPVAGNKFFMVMIYGLLKKLKEVNRELAYERKADVDQDDIDALVNGLLN
jgi:CRP/FNR family transcriptional regulator, cyclic AMP receptor protein